MTIATQRMRGRALLAIPLFAVLAAAAPAEKPAPVDKGRADKVCVQKSLVAAPVVRDDGLVYLRGQPDQRRSYIVRFKGECPGLTGFSAIVVETSGMGYCEGDKVRPFTPPSNILGPSCVIDRFEPFSGAVDTPVSR